MQIAMMINRISRSTAPKTVVIDGEATDVQVAQTEVELVDPTGKHGSMVLRMRTDAERAYADSLSEGAEHSITV